MPPHGESTGLAMEDSVLLARIFEKLSTKPVSEVFEAYEKTRKPRVNAAYKAAVFRWSRVRDKSWATQKLEEWFTWAWMWYKSDDFEKSFAYDITKEAIIE
jgi:salicylate hydroxylase